MNNEKKEFDSEKLQNGAENTENNELKSENEKSETVGISTAPDEVKADSGVSTVDDDAKANNGASTASDNGKTDGADNMSGEEKKTDSSGMSDTLTDEIKDGSESNLSAVGEKDIGGGGNGENGNPGNTANNDGSLGNGRSNDENFGNTGSNDGSFGNGGNFGGDGEGNRENGFFPNTQKPSLHEAPNAAEVLNSYLFGTADTKKIKPPKKDSPALKRFMKTACLILLTLAVSFSGAFACFYWVCNTALLGDSDFFRTLMLQGSGITVNRVEVDMVSGSYEEDTIALADKISQCSVDIQIFTEEGERAGSGSGVILSADGLAITNYHVVYGYEKNTKAVLSDGTVCGVTVLRLDKISDLAVIKIDTGKRLTPAVWGDSTKLKKGQSIAICGNPLGLGGSVSFGKIGHPDRDLGEVAGKFIQLDVSVNPGNSGGGVFDGAGNLIGIVNSKASGSNVDGIGYAIPSERAMDVVNQLLDDGVVDGRPAIGFTLVQVNQSTWDYFKNGDGTAPGELNGHLFEAKYGIYIIKSEYNTEILKGDRIVSCNGIAFDDRDNFSSWLLKYKPGDTVRITVERIILVTQNPDGSYNVTREQKTFECVLQERTWPDEPYQK